MIKKIVKEPHKVLRKKAEELLSNLIATPKIQELISDMKETLASTPDGVGLAAPQVGESLRIFIVSEEAEEIDRTQKRGWKRRNRENPSERTEKPYQERKWKYYVFINPHIKNISKQKFEDAEGCLSVPGKYGLVRRYEKITVAAYDEQGRKFTRGTSRFFARVMQHELDHLEGILFIDTAERLLENASAVK